MSAATPPLAFRLTHPGLGLLWAAGASPAGTDPITLRRTALHGGSAPLPGERPFAALEPLREVTLLDGARLTGPALRALLQAVWAAPGNPLVRLEFTAEELAALAPGAAEARGWRKDGLAQVHVLFQQPALPEGLPPVLEQIAGAGLPLAAEIYLERGVTDGPDALRALLLELVRLRCRPYFLVDGAWLPPGRRVAAAQRLALVRSLRGWISGLAVPQMVEESPTGVRTPRIPEYLQEVDGEGATVRGFRGTTHRYPHLPPEGE